MLDKLANVYYEVGYKVDESGFKKSDDMLKKVEGDVGSIANKITGALAIGATVAATLAVGINKATEQFAEFDYQLAKVNAKGDQTAESYKVLKDAAFEAGKSTIFTSKQAAKGLEYMAMAGWSAVDSSKALPAALDMAVVAGEDLSVVTDILTDQMTVFGLKAEQAGHFADLLAYGANKSNTSVAQLGEALKYAGPPMKALGSSVEETTALFMSMADGGIKASQAGTALRMSAIRLVKPTKESAKAMKQLRIEMLDKKTGEFKGMTSFIEQFTKATENMTKAERLRHLATIVGTESSSAFATVIEQGTDKINKNTEALKTNDGYAKKSANYLSGTLQGQLEATASKQEALSLKIGETFSPAKLQMVKQYNSLLDSMITKLSDSSEESQKLSDFSSGFTSIMIDGMKFVGEAIYDSVILPLKFVGNTLDTLSFGQFSKSIETFASDVTEIGEKKRVEQEYTNKLLLTEKKETTTKKEIINKELRVEKPVIPASQQLGMQTSIINKIGDIIINPPASTVKNEQDLGIFVKKTVQETLDLNNKKMLNKINPKKGANNK
ncbi:MAG: phage tail tape measure protein [Cetobacterium sp.]|uniref:phage tail tape measure protein n=1 Tax=Cetobacterium sp. TaxID=2071632 RepID=UPI002FCB9E77